MLIILFLSPGDLCKLKGMPNMLIKKHYKNYLSFTISIFFSSNVNGESGSKKTEKKFAKHPQICYTYVRHKFFDNFIWFMCIQS